MYYAHSKEDKTFHSLSQHLNNCATLSSQRAEKFNAENWGYLCGLFHDLGKYSNKFQDKLKGIPNNVRHTSAGSIVAIEKYGDIVGKLLAYIISGHHSGLKNHGTKASIDDGTLMARLTEAIEDFSFYKEEISLNPPLQLAMPFKPSKEPNELSFSVAFFIRMVFSCLVDSDFIDTETFMTGEKDRGGYPSISSLCNEFNIFLKTLDTATTNPLNKKRQDILKTCIKASENQQGLYSLTVPTGGGKTFSSMAFALNHARINNLHRIIYVIPYTSIIEQNAAVFKEKLGESSILEHHSNFLSEDEKFKLASENWDIPIVVTTNVQFFQSLYANKSSKCRKLHNIAKSVIVFDEVQMLPTEYLKPCTKAINELVQHYKVTALLCSATQPPLQKFFSQTIHELIPNSKELSNEFKKVEIEFLGEMENIELINRLNKEEQFLCIVNTKKHALDLFNQLESNKYHLSTNMCAIHRKKVLSEIKEKLKNKESCKVISTQLIEAGVDIDFPVVYRSLSGLDSIIQAAGRCNREGKLKQGNVYVFESLDKTGKAFGYMEQCAKISKEIFRNSKDILSLEAMEQYFQLLYFTQGEQRLDKKNILNNFNSIPEFNFETAAKDFNLIENNTTSIIIPYDITAKKLIDSIKYAPFPMSFSRQLQPYAVNLYYSQFKALEESGQLENINGMFWVLKENNYNEKTGILMPLIQEGEAIFG